MSEAVQKRQRNVAGMHEEGRTVTHIALALKVSRTTIHSDFVTLGLHSWDLIDDDDLLDTVEDIVHTSFSYVGRRVVEAHLLAVHGLRICRRRIVWAMAQLQGIRTSPRRIKRRPYYR